MKNILAFTTIFALAIAFSFCKKAFDFTTNSGDKLEFSTDTLRFDTVFTQLGSATRILKIYNTSKKWLRVSKISLEKGADSKFQINVDGLSGRVFENLEIAPKDSLYIFAEVTINPDQPLSESPFILDENLVFETNGNTQKVVLEAWGQNANYYPSRFSADSLTLYTCQFDTWTWDDPKPYVIWGGVFIDECELKIPAGARVYFHGGLATRDSIVYNDGFLFIQKDGKLTVEGTKNQPVLFASDRIEAEFSETPGQWAGIRIGYGSKDNRIEYATIKNSIIGIRVDSAAELSLKNVRIYNTASTGLLGIHSTISAENCLFYNNSGFCAQLEYGGIYNFDYCTMTTFGVGADALRFGNTLCLDETCTNFDLFPLFARFKNCIFMGSRADQIALFDRSANPLLDFNYRFENCVVRVKDILKIDQFPDFLTDHCFDCLNAKPSDGLFVNYQDNDFHLDSLSIANGKGQPLPSILIDLEDKMRDATNPDLGCFESDF